MLAGILPSSSFLWVLSGLAGLALICCSVNASGQYRELAEAEVRQLDVSPFVEQHVVGFQVAVDVVQLVDAFDGHDLSIAS
jgi:hypothetical protein